MHASSMFSYNNILEINFYGLIIKFHYKPSHIEVETENLC